MESALDSVGGVTDVAVNLATVRATDLFPGKVDYFKALPGLGACGVVNGKKCILGNLRLMQREGAAMNGLDEKARVFAAEGKTCVFLADGGKVVGLVALSDVPKVYANEAIADLKSMGLRTAFPGIFFTAA